MSKQPVNRWTNARIPAKRVLVQAEGRTGKNVIVVGGADYLASSMPTRNDADKAAIIALLQGAIDRVNGNDFPLPTNIGE